MLSRFVVVCYLALSGGHIRGAVRLVSLFEKQMEVQMSKLNASQMAARPVERFSFLLFALVARAPVLVGIVTSCLKRLIARYLGFEELSGIGGCLPGSDEAELDNALKKRWQRGGAAPL